MRGGQEFSRVHETYRLIMSKSAIYNCAMYTYGFRSTDVHGMYNKEWGEGYIAIFKLCMFIGDGVGCSANRFCRGSADFKKYCNYNSFL